ncbi:MAG: cation:proton antiporter [Methanosphaera sp.]|nr:cation:proton antiporter [Methanosphaera sp.]
MDLYLLESISVVLFTAVLVLLVFNRLKLSTTIGLFITGMVLNQFITSTDIIDTISGLGVIFLLFIIGLEFSVEQFSAIKKYAVVGGILQVVTTTIITTALMFILGFPLNEAIFMGFLICFSSTAIVMKIMQKQHLNHSMTGRVTLGILIFQDIAVIVVLLFTPILGGQSLDMSTLPRSIVQIVGLAIILILGSNYVVPAVLEQASKTKNRDLFMLIILLLCFGITYATSTVGISEELGAFIAGLMISNTDYSHQALGYMQPFQDVFLSIYLISIGLMINVQYLIENIVFILFLTAIVLIIKFVASFITGQILKLPLRTNVSMSLLLTQVGEFSFILASQGMIYGLISESLYTTFLTVSVLTMTATPFLERLSPKITGYLKRIPYFQVDDELKKVQPEEIEEDVLEDHVIIVGFGVNGKNLSRACNHYDIPYVIIDMNPIIVEREKNAGEPIIYGDASNESVLKEAKITSATSILIATSDYNNTVKAVDTARRLNTEIHIIVRTRYMKNVDELYDTGADEVIPEEFETSIVMFTLIMEYYDKDMSEITDIAQNLRAEKYDTFRCISPEEISTSLSERITDLDVESVYVTKSSRLSDYEFKSNNLTVTSIIRDNETITDFNQDFKLKIDDLILFTGTEDNIKNFLNPSVFD